MWRRGQTTPLSMSSHQINRPDVESYSDSVEAISFQLGNVGGSDAVSLDAVDVYNEILAADVVSHLLNTKPDIWILPHH